MPVLVLFLLMITPLFSPVAEERLLPLGVETRNEEMLELPFQATDLSLDLKAEADMLELLNAERRKHGLRELVLDEELTLVARRHSLDMWERSYFAHENPDGESPFDRMEEGEVDFHEAGENLALARTTMRAHNGLMNSDGHRKNILDPDFARVGIGAIDGGIYGKMFTQNFAD